jgi:tartrate/fumarate subfamily iron-sulfur-dependent hydro-lyase beta chain
MNEHYINIPIKEKQVRGLKLGDIVYLSGAAFLSGMLFHQRVVEMGLMPEADLGKCNVFWHTGILVKKQGAIWKVTAAGATTSIRYEKWTPALIELMGLRAIIGKGSMGQNTLNAMQRFGCVHLGKLGMATGALNARAIKQVLDVEWLELGKAEALWTLQVEKLGPFVVDMDANGGMLYDKIYAEIDKVSIPRAYDMIRQKVK